MSQSFIDDDAQLNTLLYAATDYVSNYIGNWVALTTLETKTNSFSGLKLEVQEGNFYVLDSIVYTDRNGQQVTLTTTGYTIEEDEFSFTIEFDQWVDTESLTINYKCGFDNLNIKPLIKSAILIKLTDLYDIERASYTNNGIQYSQRTLENLLNYYKKITLF